MAEKNENEKMTSVTHFIVQLITLKKPRRHICAVR